jgi:hypothetical protein
MKLQTERENSNYFMRLGNTALSHQGGALVAGEKAPKNVFKLKNKSDSLHEFPASTSLWWPLLSNRQKLFTAYPTAIPMRPAIKHIATENTKYSRQYGKNGQSLSGKR